MQRRTFEPAAGRVFKQLEDALLEGRDIVYRVGPDGCGPQTRRLIEFMNATGEELLSFHGAGRGVRGADVTEEKPWPPRSLLLAQYSGTRGRGRFWFRQCVPTTRELALLSILAGNFPDRVREQFANAKTLQARPTVADAIKEEMRTLRVAMKTADAKLAARRARLVKGEVERAEPLPR